jgi:hypothetical protein
MLRKLNKKIILKIIPKVWQKISLYLNLNLSWEEFLYECKNNFKNFRGFRLIKSKYPPWYAGIKIGKISYAYMAYYPFIKKEKLEFKVAHELLHIFRDYINKCKFRQVGLVSYLLEEALCDIIAAKAIRKREKELRKYGLYNLIDICALEKIIYNLGNKEIRRIAFMPKNEKELKELTIFVLNLISTKKFIGAMKSVWKYKIKEEVYF